jgi:hypothetical protein
MIVATRKRIKPANATFINLLENLKDLVLLSIVRFKVLLAKIYVNPIRNVAEIFRTKKAIMLVLTIPVKSGFNSTAPK